MTYPPLILIPVVAVQIRRTDVAIVRRYAWHFPMGFRLTSLRKLGIWTQLALAYAIHKSFIFIRVPLTAAVTPKVVRVLRGWGWDIGKRKSKAGVMGKGLKGVGKE